MLLKVSSMFEVVVGCGSCSETLQVGMEFLTVCLGYGGALLSRHDLQRIEGEITRGQSDVRA